MGKPEGAVESYLIKRCKELGYLEFKFTAPGKRGVPDRIVIANGITAFVELKSSVGRLSEIQKVVIRKMAAHGALIYVCPTKQSVDNALADMILQATGPPVRDPPEQACES